MSHALMDRPVAGETAKGNAAEIIPCGESLSHGRSCCHLRGHDGRHSHTWQQGDARYVDIDEKLIDMETGEVVGYSGGMARQIIEEITGERINPRQPESLEEKQAKARRVLEVQYGARFPAGKPQPVYAYPPTEGYKWHYEGTFKAYGRDASGNDVQFDFQTGKVSRIYSVNERGQAVDYARRFGATKAARKFGIPVATIRTWVSRTKS